MIFLQITFIATRCSQVAPLFDFLLVIIEKDQRIMAYHNAHTTISSRSENIQLTSTIKQQNYCSSTPRTICKSRILA